MKGSKLMKNNKKTISHKVLSIMIACSLLPCKAITLNTSATFVNYKYASSDSNGVWEATDWKDTSTANQFVYTFTDCWKNSSGTRYHEHIIMTRGSTPITRMTATVAPVYYYSGSSIGPTRVYNTYNGTRLRVNPQAIYSGGNLITLFATLETQHTTATYTYHNIYGI